MGDDSAPLARSTVLRLRGLPFQATEADVEHFFEGYKLTRCVICQRSGRATGEAYVQLESEALAGRAMQELNCKYVGRRYIEIFEALETDIATNVACDMNRAVGFVLRLRGLPYSATRVDVEAFFDGLEICPGEEGVVFSVTSLGRPTGEAYVEFMSEESQQEAMKKHKQHMGSRYIELFKSTRADLLQALQQNRFYREQAQKRQLVSQTVIGLPSSIEASQRLRMQGYNIPSEDVTDVLKGLSMRDRSQAMLSPAAQPFQSTGYDRFQSVRVPAQQYLPHQSGYAAAPPQYFFPDQTVNRAGLSGRPYRGGGMYEVQSPPRVSQQSLMPPPDVMVRHQGPYMMRPPVMQQPPQLMLRYPSQGTWMSDRQQSPLSPVNSGISPSFSPQYGAGLPGGLMTGSPSGSIPSPYSGAVGPRGSLPEALDGNESFEFSGKSGSSSRKS